MKRLLTSCFGLGFGPVAPGTWGSLPPAVVFALMCHFNATAFVISAVMVLLVMAGSVVCVKFTPSIIVATGKKDPGEIVADEFAGQALTFSLAIPFLSADSIDGSGLWAATLLGFFLFRLFDVLKPWPIRKLEQLPEGWGVLLDDLLAAVYAAIALVACYRLWLSWFAG